MGCPVVVSVQHPDSGAPLQKLSPMEEPTEDSGRPSSRRPASSPAPPGAGAVPTPRSCSLTSGAARRCSIALRQQTSVGRQVHWWQMRKMMRLVRPQSGKRENGRSGTGRGWRRKTGWGRFFKGVSFFSLIFLFPLLSLYRLRLAVRGARKP